MISPDDLADIVLETIKRVEVRSDAEAIKPEEAPNIIFGKSLAGD